MTGLAGLTKLAIMQHILGVLSVLLHRIHQLRLLWGDLLIRVEIRRGSVHRHWRSGCGLLVLW